MAFIRAGDLRTMNADGSDQLVLTRRAGVIGPSLWSSNGQCSACEGANGYSVDVVKADGSAQRRLGTDAPARHGPDSCKDRVMRSILKGRHDADSSRATRQRGRLAGRAPACCLQ